MFKQGCFGVSKEIIGFKSFVSFITQTKRKEIEEAILREQTKADIQREKDKLQLRQQQREMEMMLEEQKEAHEFVQLKRQKQLTLKMRKLDLMGCASTRSSVSSATSTNLEEVKTRNWMNSVKNYFSDALSKTKMKDPLGLVRESDPCSSKQANARIEKLRRKSLHRINNRPIKRIWDSLLEQRWRHRYYRLRTTRKLSGTVRQNWRSTSGKFLNWDCCSFANETAETCVGTNLRRASGIVA